MNLSVLYNAVVECPLGLVLKTAPFFSSPISQRQIGRLADAGTAALLLRKDEVLLLCIKTVTLSQ
jgi:hypothetical protein